MGHVISTKMHPDTSNITAYRQKLAASTKDTQKPVISRAPLLVFPPLTGWNNLTYNPSLPIYIIYFRPFIGGPILPPLPTWFLSFPDHPPNQAAANIQRLAADMRWTNQ